MKCRECRADLKSWIQQGGTARLSPDAERHAKDCPDCGAAIHAARLLVTAGGPGADPSSYLAPRVMARLRDLEAKPRRLTRLVPVAALVMVIVAGGAFLAGRLTGRPGGLSRTVVVEFRVEIPEVQSVHLVGDFNGWDTESHPLSDPDRDGIWVTTVRLLPGSEYRYQFHVDGSRWMADPASDFQIEDGYGGKTSVLQI